MKKLIVASAPRPSADALRLVAFARHMGVTAEAVALARDSFAPLDRDSCTLALSCETLASLAAPPQLPTEGFRAILIFGCDGSPRAQKTLGSLTGGAICGVSTVAATTPLFAFPPESKPLTRQLAGLGFAERYSGQLAAFDLHPSGSQADVLMTADERPIFVRVPLGACDVFLSAAPMPELDAPLSRELGLEEHYVSLIPALIFLRHCFGQSVWHGVESTARLIVDDPLLTRRYGFLKLDALIESMRRLRYGTSIAFIPWNAWRTSKRAAARLLAGSNLSLCVHGCDHTNREFQAADARLLESKAALAMRRMIAHRNRAGAPFEDVMVFPQGRFSAAALPALRAGNYLAAVNSTCFPANAKAGELTVRDFLQPAIDRYGGFPIFSRRYPQRLFDLAFDLFLGKPALIVEHHEYFKQGLGAVEALAAALHEIEPALAWPDLSTQLSRCCLRRTGECGAAEVRFFTRRFQFANRTGCPHRFLLSKHEPEAERVAAVLVDGVAVPFAMESSFLQLEIESGPGQVHNIEILDRERPLPPASGLGAGYQVRVALRRALSEFRDNTLARHSGLLKAARKAARLLRTTGES